MAFSPRLLEDIKNRISLVEIIGRTVRLIKKGREFHGLCPFHQEKTPSFTVNEDKGFFHCFGCGEHGSVFDFIMKTRNLNFPEAVEQLANEANIEIPITTPEELRKQKRSRGIHEVMELATIYYENILKSPSGEKANQYLKQRGIIDKSVKEFRLGFAPNSRNQLRTELSKKGIPDALMIDAGLLIRPDNVERAPYDRFRGRIIFPIGDKRGKIIAFGGRALGDREPKYLNSPETPIFTKGHNLYSLDRASNSINKADKIIVVEGYTDVISLYQAGYKNCVAPLGTALTESQVRLLWRWTSEPILCFDGDTAGQRAAGRAATNMLPHLKPEKSLSFVLLPEGEDPDNLIKTQGVNAIKSLINVAEPLSEILWRISKKGYRLETPEDRAGFDKRLREMALLIEDKTVQKYYLDSFKQRLWEEFTRSKKPGQYYKKAGTPLPIKNSTTSGTIDVNLIQQAILIITLINYPMLIEKIGEQLAATEFNSSELDKLRQEVLKTLASNPTLNHEELKDYLNKNGFLNLLGILSSGQFLNHTSFAQPGGNIELVHRGWEQTFRLFQRNQLLDEIKKVEKELAENPTREVFDLLIALKETIIKKEDAEFI